MKKIFLLILLIFSLFIISCKEDQEKTPDENKENISQDDKGNTGKDDKQNPDDNDNGQDDKDNKYKISYYFDENNIDAYYDSPKVITINDIPNNDNLIIDDIFYDKDFNNQYNKEELSKDTELYVRTNENSFTITYVVYFTYASVTYSNPKQITTDDIPNMDKNDIEGIYYDGYFNKKYNGETLSNDITLYVKDKNIDYSKPLFIQLYVDNEINNVIIYKNMPISLDYLRDNGFYQYSKDILGLYYDENYQNPYNGERISSSTVLYAKIDKSSFSVVFRIKNKYIENRYNNPITINEDDIPFFNKNIIQGLYLDTDFTNSFNNNTQIDKNTTLYVKLNDINLNIIDGENEITVDYPYNQIIPIGFFASEWQISYFEGVYYDNQYTIPYFGLPLYEDTTLYVKKSQNILPKETKEAILNSFSTKVSRDDLEILAYLGKINGLYAVSFYEYVTPIPFDFTVESLHFTNQGHKIDGCVFLFDSNYNCYMLNEAYDLSLISLDDLTNFYQIYNEYYEKIDSFAW